MKIKNRLTFLTSLTFGVVFIGAAVVIYILFYQSSEKRIYNDLQKICLLSAIYYLEQDELPLKEHKQIKQQYDEHIKEVEVGIYDANNKIAYGKNLSSRSITPDLLNSARKKGKLTFKSKENFYASIFYRDNQGDFVVIVKASDTDFTALVNQLMLIMGLVLVVGLIVIFFVSRLLSNLAYKPIDAIIEQVNEIEASSLDRIITNVDTDDELQKLIESYNNLLKRLADTFKTQKNFINYVSHEFKTPLASISGHLEVFAQKERSPEEYQNLTQKVIKNVYEVEQILNTLLIVSGLKIEVATRDKFRLDELIWSINDSIAALPQFKNTVLQIEFHVVDQNKLEVKGNESEISMAVYNIIENAVKYANGKPVAIELAQKEENLQLTISDQGTGISTHDLKHIHETFYRGTNVGSVQGSGIGLSLASILFAKNNIAFAIDSEKEKGTTVILQLPYF